MPKHRHIGLKRIVESTPKPLLKEYFKRMRKGSPRPKSFDYESIKKFVEESCKEEQRIEILEDFNVLDKIAEKQPDVLVRVAKDSKVGLNGDVGMHELAMLLFLKDERAYGYVYTKYCLSNTSKLSQHALGAVELSLTNDTLQSFEKTVREFYASKAMGRDCVVKRYDEGDECVIVVMHGLQRKSVMVWQNQGTGTIFIRPAHEDILQFDRTTSLLSIKASYGRDRENYIRAFGEHILGDVKLVEKPEVNATYSLEPLQKGKFSYAGNEKIKSVILTEVKIQMRGQTNPTVVVNSSNVVGTFSHDIKGLNLDSGELVHAKFKFTLQVDKKMRDISFVVTPPSVTDLPRKKYSDIIGEYLKQNGVKLV